MNYRHGFHAGNPADCVKHTLLVWLLAAMARKPAPFLVLDTHAGAGAYDLAAAEAERTGEWRRGIGRLQGAPDPALRDYLAAVARAAPPGSYPGSPALAHALMRPQDRLVCCELHPQEHAALQGWMGARAVRPDAPSPGSAALREGMAGAASPGDGGAGPDGGPRIGVHLRDGYAALRAFLPPPEHRALVLLDPPFEAPDEFDRLAQAIGTARARFPSAVLAAWYPVKGRAPVRRFQDALRGAGLRDLVAAELWLRAPTDPGRLNGCGLLVASPPWRFEAEATPILQALLARLGDGEDGAGIALTRLAKE